MKLPNNLMPKQVTSLPLAESHSMNCNNKKLLVGPCKESINEQLQFSTPEICKVNEKNEFRLRGEKIDNNTISLTLNITETSCCQSREVEFSFYLDSDTAVSVAEEMVEQLELSPEDAACSAKLIDTLVMKLVPSLKTSCGSIASAPDQRHPDCLQSVREQEALQSFNSEISAEQDMTISSCARTNKPLGSFHCDLQLNTHNLGSDFMMLDDGCLPEHKKSARNFVSSWIGSCFGRKNKRACPASTIHTKQKKLTS
jgi:WNK lysine deficient protein kinase